ncbi:DUF3618 domain-containing protein [Plantactinospora sp. BB1]|uniref:DUF3618 domain-containing protein n=1 Tax=Plantactinospora sp. BB1 TaxID=2071627 RepID=UPI000D15FA9C|nr:DUF3618 domain-containing protein [Plantactinospora sp. BB1]AVT35773.1 hypothetical protein C6W10_04080 [Plantactinospora sp. BB1]
MSTDPGSMRADVDRTQDRLGENLSALGDRMNPRNIGDRVNPRNMAQHQAGRARNAWQRMRESVMGTAEHARQDVAGAVDRTREGAQQARGGMQRARETSQAGISSAGHRIQEFGQQTRKMPEGHPLAAGLVAFGLGVLASALLPASSAERRAVGKLRDEVVEHSDQIKQQASGIAQQAQQNLRGPAQQAVESVRSRAGQHAGEMRDQARSSAEDLRGQTQETMGEVRRR